MKSPALSAFAALAVLCAGQLAAQESAWARGGHSHSSSHASAHASHSGSHPSSAHEAARETGRASHEGETHSQARGSEKSSSGERPAPTRKPAGPRAPTSWRWGWGSRPARPRHYYYGHTAGGHAQGAPCDPQASLGGPNQDARDLSVARQNQADCVAREDDDDFQDNAGGPSAGELAAGGAGVLGVGAIGAAMVRRRRKSAL